MISRALTLKKLFNLWLLKQSYLIAIITRRYVHWGMPANISVEPTSLCNLACPECPSGNGALTRRRGNMTFSDFRKYIDPYISTLITCTLYFQGEPLLNPEIFKMIGFLKKKGIYTIVSTNGQFLSASNCEKLIVAGISRVIVSLDGTTQESYVAYRRAGSVAKTVDGVKTLVETRKKLKALNPLIILQFLVFKHNQHQLVAIKKMHREVKTDRLWLKAPQVYNFKQNADLLPTMKKFNRYTKDNSGEYVLKGAVVNKCWRSWQNPVITIDGEMLPCCFDKDAKHIYGSVNSADTPWQLDNAVGFRKQILKNRKALKMCRNCTEGVSYLFRS